MSQAVVESAYPRRVSSFAGEQDPRALTADIPPNVLAHLSERATRRGMSCEAWFNGVGITHEQVNDPSLRVSYRQARTVVARALRSLREPALGLAIGRHQTVGSFGLLGLAMTTSRNVGEAMQVGINHHKVSGSLLDVDLKIVDERTAAVQASPRFGESELTPFLCEELFARSLSFVRELVGRTLTPTRLELTYPAPSYASEYGSVFECDIQFGAKHNRILVDTHWLELPLPGYNLLTSKQTLALCDQQMRGSDCCDEIVCAVERLLRSRLHEHLRLTEVARTLHLSERSLRRKLHDRGYIFRDIHDRVRAERALELLHAGRLSVADIGVELGFSDPREFRRAFKRWTGMSPLCARQSLPRAHHAAR